MTDALPEGVAVDLTIEAGRWPSEDELREVVLRAIHACFAKADLKVLDNSEISLLFTDDEAIRKLNGEWRDKDKPTNVLSFPGSDPNDETYGPLLGDIVFACETISREAQELGVDFSDHLSHLTVHGLLHLFDYDHQEREEAELMESLEKAVLASIDIDDPYADSALVADGG
ncbi:rRNA maturation RNase YbeY [uncultured Roseibium sp.]|uniref:rRNA maturation RNase YbeY n=1 Tax=uncultured Roseibium sp. TaxID=1936171 RepID=UPI00262A4E7C|nr:rRNA maturation RNase YbeY [uncultured Roseibium sp.]